MDTEEISGAKKPSRRFAARIRQEREHRGWTQSQLAEEVGTTQTNVSLWERGATVPGPYFRQKLAEVFKKSLVELGLIEEEQENVALEHDKGEPVSSTFQPVWNVPYRRNAYFTGREDILAKLAAIINAGKAAALTQTRAISGLGGIGKTQVALEYAYRYRDSYQAILWATASSRDTLTADYVFIAKLLGLIRQDESDQDVIIARVKQWLATHTNWLLILDNVDDLALIDAFLPGQSQGVILLTTRLHALGNVAKSIEIDKMEENDGKLFLLRRTKSLAPDEPLDHVAPEFQALAGEIVRALDGLPLALDQAGAYIEETHCSLQRYLTLYETYHKELLSRRGTPSADHPDSVTTTWLLSLQQIEQNNLSAVELLRLCAFLYADAIPEEGIIEGAAELGPILCKAAEQPVEFDLAIGTLLRYSLIQRDSEERILSIHRLMQMVIKDEMDEFLRRVWAERVVRMLNRIFPKAEPETWDTCQKYLPHTRIAAQYIEEYAFHFPEAARLLNQTAIYLMDHARYEEAESNFLQAKAIREQVLEMDNPDTAATFNDLGTLYYLEGKYSQAEQLLQQALTIRQQALEAKHPDIEYTRLHLAEVYEARGEYNQAEQLYEQVLDNQKKVFGEEHFVVANTLNNLATVYRAKGEYSRSEALFLRALEIQKKALGPDHPNVAQTLNNLARLYRAQGKYVEAEPHYEQALQIREQVFGLANLHVAESLSSIAKLYYSQGKYAQAVDLCHQALGIQEQGLWDKHPTIANTLIVLAKVYLVQGKYELAEEQYQRALSIRERSLGPEHPHVAVILSGLSEIYQAQERYQEALPLIERSLAIRRQTLSSNHPYLAYSLSNLAENYAARSEYARAEELYLQVLNLRKQVLGEQHPHIASTNHALAKLYLAQGRYAEAEALCQKALEAREQILGSDHPDVATSLELYVKLLRINISNINSQTHTIDRETLAGEFEGRLRKIKAKNPPDEQVA